MPVPVREVWALGDVALGLDPVERLDVYVTKDILLRDDSEPSASSADGDGDGSDLETRFRDSPMASRASARPSGPTGPREYPPAPASQRQRSRRPEQCLAAHLLGDDEPIHLEVCNSSFEDNVTSGFAGRSCAMITRSCSIPAASVSGPTAPEARRRSGSSRERARPADALRGARDARAGRRRVRSGGPRAPRLARATGRRDGTRRRGLTSSVPIPYTSCKSAIVARARLEAVRDRRAIDVNDAALSVVFDQSSVSQLRQMDVTEFQ